MVSTGVKPQDRLCYVLHVWALIVVRFQDGGGEVREDSFRGTGKKHDEQSREIRYSIFSFRSRTLRLILGLVRRRLR